jgi:DNA-binding transcriptional LysR family regulator
MKNLQGLLAFVETAAGGSLTAAADKLEVSPAAVSKSLARLEAQLGVRLMQRSTRRLALTAEGADFLERARAALRLLDEAVDGVSQAARTPAGRVRISVGIGFGRRWVQPLLPALAAAHPQLEIELSLDNRPVDLLAEGFDIGIRGGTLRDSSLVARRICALPVVLVASPAYLLRHGVPATPGELAAHQALGVRMNSGTVAPWRFRQPRRRALLEVTPAARVLTSDPEAVLDLAVAGAGICQAGLQHALPHLREGRLRLLLADVHDAGDRETVLHYPHRQFLSTRVRVVVDALLQHLAQQADLHLRPGDLPPAWRAEAAAAAAHAGRRPANQRAA